MSESLYVLLLILLLAIGISPFVLIPIGFIRRYKKNGFSFFMLGSGILSFFLSVVLSLLAENILPIKNGTALAFILFLLLLYGAYRMFVYSTMEASGKSDYLSSCRYMIRRSENAQLPSCESYLLNIISKNLASVPAKNFQNPSKRAAETGVYRLALDILDSPHCRYATGALTKEGEQLRHICRHCLDYFLSVGYITEEEYAEHMDYLHRCDVDIDRYSVL